MNNITLDYSSNYIIDICKNAIVDEYGNGLEKDYSFSFTTIPKVLNNPI